MQIDWFSVGSYVELDMLCLLLFVFFGVVAHFYMRTISRKLDGLMVAILVLYCIFLVADAAWALGESLGTLSSAGQYFVNAVYFISLTVAAVLWLLFLGRKLHFSFLEKPQTAALISLPSLLVVVLAVTARYNGLLFYINSAGVYTRGPFFTAQILVNYGYILLAGILGVVRAIKTEGLLRSRPLAFAAYSLPIILFGVLQLSGVANFTCVGYLLACIILFCYEVLFTTAREHRRKTEAADKIIFGEKRLLAGASILLVDDNDFSREINREILEDAGAKVTEASGGHESIHLFQTQGPFDVVLMDIVMPEINGIAATRAMRTLEENTERRTPIVALTAEGTDAQAEEILRAGADDCMSKPLIVSDLSRILVDNMRRQSVKIEKKLQETKRIANTDTLTHVKNIAAYSDAVAEFSNRMQKGEHLQFAVVMCDVNSLKKVNDTLGHDAGDVYIKNCCQVLCNVFCHSPVYRIGGDEFVALLERADYQNRDKLMQKLHDDVRAAEALESVEKGLASFAYGIADYNSETDLAFSDTVKRADKMMYRIKKARG